MQYFLKAKFHYDKDQFADLLLIVGIAGALSQVNVAFAHAYGNTFLSGKLKILRRAAVSDANVNTFYRGGETA